MNYRALRLGREAYLAGKHRQSNPYSRTYDRRLWNEAFDRAEAKIMAPYGEMCRDPNLCRDKGYCPRDPTCGD